jgi:hypothetical protein
MLGKHKLIGLSAVFGLFLLFFVAASPRSASASTGIEPYLSFEGKIVTSASGINIPDGNYNMEFKIYDASTGCTPTTGSGCHLSWTEDWLVSGGAGHYVTFTSGTYQVNLGTQCPFSGGTCGIYTNTAINWNSYPLYLSLQIGNTSSCTPTSTSGAGDFQNQCGGDGEMLPYILLTSTPYAMNAGELGGVPASSFAQLATTNTWTGTTTWAGANVIQPTTNVTGLTVIQNTAGSPSADIFDVQTYNNTDAIQVTGPSQNVASVLIQGIGTGNVSLITNSSSSGIIAKTATNSATAFQVENNNGNSIFSVNTVTPAVQVAGALTSSIQTAIDSALIQNTGGNTNAFTVDNSQGVPIITAGNNNLLINGDFESGAGTTGWAAATAGGSIALNADPRYVYSGSNSLAITTTTTAHTGAQVTSFNNSMAAGTYTLSFDAAVASGSFATLEASFNALGTNNCLSGATVTTTFTEFSCTYTTSGTTTAVSIGSSGTTAQTFYIDAVTVTSAGSNLITNPGFESGITGWTAYGTGTGSIAWNQNRQNVYLGIGSIKINITAANYGIQDSTYIANQPVTGGTYTLSFYAMATTAINVSASLGPSSTCTLNSSTASTNGFSEYYCPNVSVTASPIVEIFSTSASGTLYVDAVQLISGSTLSPYNIGQIQLRGIIDNPITLQSTTNSTTALQVANTNGTSLLTVDTANSNVTIDNSGLAGTVQIGNINTASVNQNVYIGNNSNATSTDVVTIGNLNGTSSVTTVQGGTSASGAISIQSGAAGLLLLQTVNNGPIQTGTGGFTLGSSETFNGTSLRTITGPTTGGLTMTDAGGPLTLSTTGSGTVTLAVTSAGALNLTGAAASEFETSAGNIILRAATTATATVQIGNGNGGTGSATPDILALDDLSSGSTAPTEVNGGMYYSDTTNSFLCGVAGTWETCAGQLYSNTAVGTAVGTCTTACGAVASAPIPANYCLPGKTIRIFASGTYADTTAAPTLSFGFYYGTNNASKASDTLIGVASPASSETAVSTTQPWFITYNIICFSATSMSGSGTITIETNTTTTTTNLMNQFVATTTTGLTTTSAANLYLFPALGTSNAANTVTDSQFIVTGSN